MIEERVYLSLVHYPVYNHEKKIVTTSVTSLDVHDIARIAKTYECKGYYLVTPVAAQRDLVWKVVNHWKRPKEELRDHPRRDAMGLVSPANDLDEVLEKIKDIEGEYPTMVGTSARMGPRTVRFDEMKGLLRTGKPFLFVFGTGWGLTEDVMDRMDLILEPIKGRKDYNHLPVRAAVAIILDRLLGVW